MAGTADGVRPAGASWRRRAGDVVRFLLLTAAAFVFAEGLANTVVVLAHMAGTRLAGERLHTRYDPQLGWASLPNVSLPDLYGPGIGLSTNSLGFRGRLEVAPLAPGRERVVCSGDSFTLGFGVRDEDTWCEQLSTLDPRLSAVNMGQAGYGIDQAYLWYRRDGARLPQRYHVFAFIADDFARMLRSDFYGFGKPRLELASGRLAVRNVPVPRAAYLLPWLTANRHNLRELRSYALSSDLAASLWRRSEPAPADVLPVFFAVMDELAADHRARGIELLLVYLPSFPECVAAGPDAPREALRVRCLERGLRYVDLVPRFQALPPAVVERLFLPGPPVSRHPSPEGHRFIAQAVLEELGRQPAVRAQP